MLLFDAFLENSQIYPDKTAVKTTVGELTYSQFNNHAKRLAAFLQNAGLRKGERVVLFMDNSLELSASIYGVLMAGGVFVPVNPTTKYHKLCYILNDCEAKVLIIKHRISFDTESLYVKVPSLNLIVKDENPSGAHPSLKSIFEQNTQEPSVRIIDADLAALIYTSGSTGNPKGVMMNHYNMVSAVNSITTYLQNVPDDIVLNVLPMSFDYGLYQLLMVLSFGGTIVLERDFLYPASVVQQLLKENITGFPGVPTIFALLFKMDNLKNYDFPKLRYITNTGAALPEEFILKLRNLFPKTQIYSMYGLTECKRVSYLPPAEIDKRPNSVGVPMPNCEVDILDEDGRPVKRGQVGELVVRGSNVMQGYWNLPEETAAVLMQGKHPYEKMLRTGDLFRMDEDGYLYFVARKDDMIKSKGEKVSPKEIEEVLYKLNGVEEAAAIGVNDDILGQAIKAFVKLSSYVSLNERDVIWHCAQNLESHCVPKYVEFVSELPKSPNGKIDKKRILETEIA